MRLCVYHLSNRSMSQLIGMNPILSFAVCMTIQRTKQDFGILRRGGVRTHKEQAEMYAQGRTTPGNKITWTLNSKHKDGNAVDLVAFVDGKPTWEDKYYKEIEIAMKSVIKDYALEIDYGFDLWGKDKPHWQITHSQYDVKKLVYSKPIQQQHKSKIID